MSSVRVEINCQSGAAQAQIAFPDRVLGGDRQIIKDLSLLDLLQLRIALDAAIDEVTGKPQHWTQDMSVR